MSSFDDDTFEFRRGYRTALADMEAEAHTLKSREPAASSLRLVAEIENLRMMLSRLREVTEQVDQAIESVENTRQHATEMLAAAIYASPESPVLLGQLREKQEVKVSGVPYQTIIDPQGVQRFVADPIIEALWECGALDLNKMAVAYQTGKPGLTMRQYAELHMKLGYSVSGFQSLSEFREMEIENPLWENTERGTHERD